MGTKSVPAKPSELVILAINNLEDKDGSSAHDIVKFISQEFHMKPDEISPRVAEALKRAITYGILVQKDGKYKLQSIPGEVDDKSESGKDSLDKKLGERKKKEKRQKKKVTAPKQPRKRRKKSMMKTSLNLMPKEMKLRQTSTRTCNARVCNRCHGKTKFSDDE